MSDIVHPFLGPLLIITYALLSNTLLLTVLVAILGNTFATINADAAAEVSSPVPAGDIGSRADQQSMFRKAVSTLEGVKAGTSLSWYDLLLSKIPADAHRCGLQLPAAFQSGRCGVHVANELYSEFKMVSSIMHYFAKS